MCLSDEASPLASPPLLKKSLPWPAREPWGQTIPQPVARSPALMNPHEISWSPPSLQTHELGLESSLESKGRRQAGHWGRISTSQSGDRIPSSVGNFSLRYFSLSWSEEAHRYYGRSSPSFKVIWLRVLAIYKTLSQKPLRSVFDLLWAPEPRRGDTWNCPSVSVLVVWSADVGGGLLLSIVGPVADGYRR